MADREPHLRLVAEMTARLEAEKATPTSPRTPKQRARKASKTSSVTNPGSSYPTNEAQELPASQTSDERRPTSGFSMFSASYGPSSGYMAPAPNQQIPVVQKYTLPELPNHTTPFLAQQSSGFSRRASTASYSVPATPTSFSHNLTTSMQYQQRSTNSSMSTRQFQGNELILGSPSAATPRISTAGFRQRTTVSPGSGIGSAMQNTPRAYNTNAVAGRKRRLSTPSAEVDAPIQAKAYVQSIEYPGGRTVEVPKPDYENGLYMPAVRPVHPMPELTAQTLGMLSCGIAIERYSCVQKCRNKGTCIHFQFVLCVKRTPDGLICAKCSQECTEEIVGRLHNPPAPVANTSQICKGKRLCPFHNHTATFLTNPINNLPIDYLATDEQKDRMVEILERAYRNEWVGSVEEIRYAMSAEEAVSATMAGPSEGNGQGNEQAKPHSAPAAMQTFRDASAVPFSMPFNESFDEMPYSMHGYAFEHTVGAMRH